MKVKLYARDASEYDCQRFDYYAISPLSGNSVLVLDSGLPSHKEDAERKAIEYFETATGERCSPEWIEAPFDPLPGE